MPCQLVRRPSFSGLEKPEGSMNAPLRRGSLAQLPGETNDYYLCDKAEERPLLAQNTVAAKSWHTPHSVKLFAPRTVAAPTNLPPPPDTPLARMLYDLTTQLQDFELSADLSLPMEGIGRGEVRTFTHAAMKGQGALVRLGIEFQPYAGPQVLLKPFDQVPIIGPFFVVRVMKVEMNPQSRRLEARVKYLWFPICKDVHEDYLKKAELPTELMKGPGWDLNRGLPVYSWQILDLVLKILEKRGAETAQKIGIDGVKPLFEKGEIAITGNFSNKKVRLGDLTLHFAPLAPGERHRLTVNGSLLEPKVKIHGLKAAEWKGSEGALRLTNAEERLEPLELQVRFDPVGSRATRYEVPSYRSQKVYLEGRSTKNDEVLRLDLEEGIALSRLSFEPGPRGPRVRVEKLTARRLSFHEKGIELKTTPGDEAVFSGLELKIEDGKIYFSSQLSGQATGELKVRSGEREVGFLQFQSLKGAGRLEIQPEPNGDPLVTLSGSFSAELPELRFLVQSEKLKASVRTHVRTASVSGLGRLQVWPAAQQARLFGSAEDLPIRIRGKGGLVTFHQDASEVEDWPELKKKLGPVLAKQVVTDFFIEPRDIEFQVRNMEVGQVSEERGEASMEITQADFGPILITGDVWGKLFARLPGGVYFPLAIPETAKMENASVRIARLWDKREGERREVSFETLALAGEESRATFSPKDQRRCGIDRQHLHATLGLFQFNPDDREIQIRDIDPHFHIYLKNPVGGGCLKIE